MLSRTPQSFVDAYESLNRGAQLVSLLTDDLRTASSVNPTTSLKTTADVLFAITLLLNSLCLVLAGVASPAHHRTCSEAEYVRPDGSKVHLFCHYIVVRQVIDELAKASSRLSTDQMKELVREMYLRVDLGLERGQDQSLTQIFHDFR
jgi:hypothetical protein